MKICNGWRQFLLCLPMLLFVPYFLSVMELHQTSTVDKKNVEKFDHLVLGPAAGQGLTSRLQCEGTNALNKTSFSISKDVLDTQETVTFVTVFTIYNSSLNNQAVDRSSETVIVGNTTFNKMERSMAILNVFINFIQVMMPHSNVIVLTDPASNLAVHRNKVSIYPIKGEYSRDKLMLQRIRSYITFLEARLKEVSQKQGTPTHYIFTDSDIAVVGDLRKVFQDYPDFHLALTFRNNKAQPLNSGFIAVRGTHNGISRAIEFLHKVLRIYSSNYMKASRMLGDQLALAWVVKSHPSFDTKRFTKGKVFSEEIDGVSVLFLPCSIYNWTPPEGAGQFHGMPLDVKMDSVAGRALQRIKKASDVGVLELLQVYF